jgi:hypothetical protein
MQIHHLQRRTQSMLPTTTARHKSHISLRHRPSRHLPHHIGIPDSHPRHQAIYIRIILHNAICRRNHQLPTKNLSNNAHYTAKRTVKMFDC